MAINLSSSPQRQDSTVISDPQKLVWRCQLDSSITSKDDLELFNNIERECEVLLNFTDGSDGGQKMCEIWSNKRDSIVVASKMINNVIVPNSGVWLDAVNEKQPLARRRALESEDSSYDSDYENNFENELDVGASAKALLVHHDEVSRTISETLAAEYDEYVTRTPVPTDCGQPEQQTLLDLIINDPNYTSRVEFALKLGYTEAQVQIALMKLGPKAGQNELLAELIKLGASVGSSSSTSQKPIFPLALSPINGIDDDDDEPKETSNLRPIVIDGSNVAISHGNKEYFSCMGIKICVDWFKARGHKEITVFVPMWRKEAPRSDAPIKDQHILSLLEAERLLVFTPSRNVGGRRMVCYDDRYIIKLAAENDGIVVSNDNYRDLISENPEYKKVVEERLLMYSFVNDRFMPPDDPLGRNGPSLNNFLRRKPKPPEVLPPPCPYGKKCTYGNKCKYYHPERGNQPQKSVTERLAEQAKLQLQEVKSRGKSRESSPGEKLKATYSLPLQVCSGNNNEATRKKNLSRTKSVAPAQSMPLESDWQFQIDSNKSVGENLHRKLQRQLTLNPNYDPRLNQIQQGNYQHERLKTDQMTKNGSHQGMGSHRQLTRLGSDGPRLGAMMQSLRTQPQNSQNSLFPPQPHFLSAHSHESLHSSVTRIASAPDSHTYWPSNSSPTIGRLNSTSDTRLNQTPPPAPFPNQIWSASATSSLIVPPNPAIWSNENLKLASRGQQLSAPVRPSSVPPQINSPLLHPTPLRPARPVSPIPTIGHQENDQRYKMFFHLASIFPEEQVRQAMQLYPDETNAQNICAAIISMFPKG